jgi:hypothetical protein
VIKALFWLGGLWWGFPVGAFAITALLTGKPHVFYAICALAAGSILGGVAGAGIAEILDRDVFAGAITGALVGLMLWAWPIGAYFL